MLQKAVLLYMSIMYSVYHKMHHKR